MLSQLRLIPSNLLGTFGQARFVMYLMPKYRMTSLACHLNLRQYLSKNLKIL